MEGGVIVYVFQGTVGIVRMCGKGRRIVCVERDGRG
jgi:hypothetical protein